MPLSRHYTQAIASPLQAGETAGGTAYVGSYNFSIVEEFQQWLRAVVEQYSILSRRIGERVTIRDRDIIRTLVRKPGRLPRWREELFQA
jgi:hypothetical protein